MSPSHVGATRFEPATSCTLFGHAPWTGRVAGAAPRFRFARGLPAGGVFDHRLPPQVADNALALLLGARLVRGRAGPAPPTNAVLRVLFRHEVSLPPAANRVQRCP